MQEVYNHSLLEINGSKRRWRPHRHIGSVIKRDFGSYEDFTTAFRREARKQFCFSAWSLIVDKAGN
jgi:Fe-Mn family superoxide dismutase